MPERPKQDRKITLIDHHSSDPKQASLCPPGAIAVYIAPKGSPLIGEIRKAAKEGGDELAQRLASQLRGKKPEMAPEGSGLDLRHGGRTLASRIAPPQKGGVVRLLLPYNGGKLAAEGLTLAENGSGSAVEVIAVRNKPALTKIEVSALRQLPESKVSLTVGPAIGWVMDDDDEDEFAKAEAFADMALDRAKGLELDGLISEAGLAEVTSGLTARSLLRIRTEALKAQGF